MAFAGADKGVAIVSSTQGDTYTERLWVKYIRWVNATTAGHELKILDNEGGSIGRSFADGQYFTDLIPIFGWVNGIDLDTLDSGEVYVYFA